MPERCTDVGNGATQDTAGPALPDGQCRPFEGGCGYAKRASNEGVSL